MSRRPGPRERGAAAVLLGLAVGCQRAQVSDDCLAIDAPLVPIGVDRPFSLTARLVCPDLDRGEIDADHPGRGVLHRQVRRLIGAAPSDQHVETVELSSTLCLRPADIHRRASPHEI